MNHILELTTKPRITFSSLHLNQAIATITFGSSIFGRSRFVTKPFLRFYAISITSSKGEPMSPFSVHCINQIVKITQ